MTTTAFFILFLFFEYARPYTEMDKKQFVQANFLKQLQGNSNSEEMFENIEI